MDFFRAGRAVLLSGGPIGTPHLWIILTDPDPSQRVAAVMVVTSRQHTDKTVTLRSRDHPFITHDSNLDFGGAKFFHLKKLGAAAKSGRCIPQADISDALLKVIRDGLLASPRTIHAIADHCRGAFSSGVDRERGSR